LPPSHYAIFAIAADGLPRRHFAMRHSAQLHHISDVDRLFTPDFLRA
jgi:hypothetical protein